MLYQRWIETVARRGCAVALVDVPTGRKHTFEEIQAAVEHRSRAVPSSHRILFPSGCGPEFLIEVLRGWKLGIPVCPLEPGQASPPDVSLPSGTVHLKSTSATTSALRWVCFSAPQLQADVDALVVAMELVEDSPNLAAISLAHSYGFSNLVLPLLLHGIPLVSGMPVLPHAVMETASRFESVSLPAVPALWAAWDSANAIPRNIRTAISAGAPLPLSLEQGIFERAGLKIHNFYGSTECGGIAYDDSVVPRQDASFIGRTLPGRRLAVGELGNLVVEGGSVGIQYWPETLPSLDRGRFVTSDAVRLEQGFVFWLGRLNDTINIAGRKVRPEEIEQILAGHASVREVVVFGVPSSDPSRNDEVVACWVDRAPVSAVELREYACERLEAWQVPRHWAKLERLPVNERGKLSRTEMRGRWIRGELRG